ncbi:Apoptosis-inducing factor homolog A-like protein [Drosera capensis]
MAAVEESGSSKRKVVVVGGGVAGSLVAKTLQFDADVTLIDTKEYFEIPWASLRAMVEPPIAKRSVIKHKDYLGNVRLITSKAVNISHAEVTLEDGQQVPYDFLVIATGHDAPFPKTKPERLHEYEKENEKIKAARSILIIGGGPTGVELAGEIAVDYPDKKVTLVHNGSRLIEFIGPKASTKTLKWLKAKGVDVKLDQYVDLQSLSAGTRTYTTSAGETIEADVHFVCTGVPLASAWLKDTVLGSSLDSSGRLVVDEHLRIKSHQNKFAIGDITDLKEIKQGYLAQQHAEKAAKNIKTILARQSETKFVRYQPARGAIAIVSLGRKEGVAQFPWFTLTGRIPGYIKSKDLFVGRTRKVLGLDPDVVAD